MVFFDGEYPIDQWIPFQERRGVGACDPRNFGPRIFSRERWQDGCCSEDIPHRCEFYHQNPGLDWRVIHAAFTEASLILVENTGMLPR